MKQISKLYLGAMTAAAAALATTTAMSGDLTDHQKLTRAIYKEAVETPTYAGSKGTPILVAKFVKRLKAAGFQDSEIQSIKTAEGQNSLVVRYPGKDSSKKGIGFLGHMDVVTAYKKDWVLDPFTLTEKDGYFLGRGTADNKMGVVGILSTFIKLRSEGYQPDRDMVIFFTDDEETGMASTKQLAKQAFEKENIEFAFNGDAGGGRKGPDGKAQIYGIQAAEKTYYTVTLRVTNQGGHSSQPRSDNAIYQLADALKKVEAHQFKAEINPVTALTLKARAASARPEVAAAITEFIKNPVDGKAADILSKTVSLKATIRTTCVTTMLNAGHAENALPQRAEATVNCRIMPGTKPETVHNELQTIVGSGVKVLSVAEATPSPASPLRDDVIAAVTYAVSYYHKGVPIVANMSAGGTDGMHFRNLGIPVYGVGGYYSTIGDHVGAHGLNEKIRVKEFYQSLVHWERLMKHATGGVQ